MEQYITADRIANAIMQEDKFDSGVYLLVEGNSDIKVYGKFIDEKTVRIRQSYGKYKQRDVYRILSERGFNSKVCIRDADFLRLPGNNKFTPDFTDDIFVTDGHDSEVMMVSSNALNNLLIATTTKEKVEDLEVKYKCSIRDLIFKLAKPIGFLRYANKIHNLGLSFKPERPEGNKIKYKKIICDKKLESFDTDVLINIAYEYSQKRGKDVCSREYIKQKFIEVSKEDMEITEIINGHDVAGIISIIISKGLNSDSKLIGDQKSVEDSLALAYELRHFNETNLFYKIQAWSALNGIGIIKN